MTLSSRPRDAFRTADRTYRTPLPSPAAAPSRETHPALVRRPRGETPAARARPTGPGAPHARQPGRRPPSDAPSDQHSTPSDRARDRRLVRDLRDNANDPTHTLDRDELEAEDVYGAILDETNADLADERAAFSDDLHDDRF